MDQNLRQGLRSGDSAPTHEQDLLRYPGAISHRRKQGYQFTDTTVNLHAIRALEVDPVLLDSVLLVLCRLWMPPYHALLPSFRQAIRRPCWPSNTFLSLCGATWTSNRVCERSLVRLSVTLYKNLYKGCNALIDPFQ